MTDLPELDSDLIELALADLAQCAEDPAYDVNMWRWHEPIRVTARCAVCLAGAVLAKTVGVEPTRLVGDISVMPNGLRLARLDDYRRGYDPLNQLDLPDVTPWREDPDTFVSDMRKVAAALRDAGR